MDGNFLTFVLILLLNLLSYVVYLFTLAIITTAVLSLLLSMNILDSRNRMVWSIADFFYRVTEPVLRPVRRRLGNFGNVDLSPLIVLIGLQLLVQPLLGGLRDWLRFGVWHV